MATLERKLERRFYTGIRHAGGRAYKVMPTEVGMPDRLVLWPGGVSHFVELKRVGESLSDKQKLLHAQWAALGTHILVLTGEAEIDQYIKDYR